MIKNQRSAFAIPVLLIAAILLTACTQSLSQAPVATPTLLPTGLFVSPFPSVENPMAMIEEFAKQTAAAQTSAAGGGATITPQAITTGTLITPQTNVITLTPTTGGPITPTNNIPTTPAANSIPSGPSSTPQPPGFRPANYTLHSGEHVYCIARRYDVDPDQILSLSGISRDQANNLQAGTNLKIPQSGAFPGSRALVAHPTTYNVLSGDETVYSIACKYGDVFPSAIASENGISDTAKLTAGQPLKIP